MWKYSSKTIRKGTVKFEIYNSEKTISYLDWINLTQNSIEFLNFFIDLLRDCEFNAYYWEVKPIDKKTLEDEFEFVLVSGAVLNSLNSNSTPFEKYFDENKEVVSFKSLRGDAQLIVPTKISEAENYTHLAKFIRKAPEHQIIKLWKKVAKEYSKIIGDEKRWLSTAGLGVHWLHVRLDSKPKYYKHKEYKLET